MEGKSKGRRSSGDNTSKCYSDSHTIAVCDPLFSPWGITISSQARTSVEAAGFLLRGKLHHSRKLHNITQRLDHPPRHRVIKRANFALARLGRQKLSSCQRLVGSMGDSSLNPSWNVLHWPHTSVARTSVHLCARGRVHSKKTTKRCQIQGEERQPFSLNFSKVCG